MFREKFNSLNNCNINVFKFSAYPITPIVSLEQKFSNPENYNKLNILFSISVSNNENKTFPDNLIQVDPPNSNPKQFSISVSNYFINANLELFKILLFKPYFKSVFEYLQINYSFFCDKLMLKNL